MYPTLAMKTYISILRGINVGGNRPLKMADLKEMYSSLGFLNCQTYIQSGNVIFSYETTATHVLEATIEAKITEKYNWEVPVIVMELDELQKVVSANPFLHDANKVLLYQHVTFLSDKPDGTLVKKIDKSDYLPTEFELIDRSVYLYCPNGYSTSKLTNSFIESKLKVKATTRNWKTTSELLHLAENANQ